MRSSFARGVALLAAMLVSQAALAQAWPNRPVRLLVPFAAGAGTNDIMARLVGQHLGAGLGQPVVIENRPGAGGIAGTDAAAKALPELIALAKANPGRLTYGSGGVGSTPHLSGELFKSLAGIDAVHVPYKGGAPALNDLVGGQLSFMIENVPGTMPFVKGAKLRALAITSAQRSPLDPALPTMAEAGVPGYEVVGWNGLVAVAGTPPEIVARLQAEVGKALRLPEVRERLAALGAEPVGSTPDEFGAFLRAEMTRWGRIIREKGIRSE